MNSINNIKKNFENLGKVINSYTYSDIMEEEYKILKNVFTYKYEKLITKQNSNYVFDLYKNKVYINDIIEFYNYIYNNISDSTKRYIDSRIDAVTLIPNDLENVDEELKILKKGIIVITEIRNAFKHNNPKEYTDEYASQFDKENGLCKISGNIKCSIPAQYIKDFGKGIKIQKIEDEKDDDYLKRIKLHKIICNSIYKSMGLLKEEILNNNNPAPFDITKYKFLKEQGFTYKEILNLPEYIQKDSLEGDYSLTELYIRILGKENLTKLNINAFDRPNDYDKTIFDIYKIIRFIIKKLQEKHYTEEEQKEIIIEILNNKGNIFLEYSSSVLFKFIEEIIEISENDPRIINYIPINEKLFTLRDRGFLSKKLLTKNEEMFYKFILELLKDNEKECKFLLKNNLLTSLLYDFFENNKSNYEEIILKKENILSNLYYIKDEPQEIIENLSGNNLLEDKKTFKKIVENVGTKLTDKINQDKYINELKKEKELRKIILSVNENEIWSLGEYCSCLTSLDKPTLEIVYKNIKKFEVWCQKVISYLTDKCNQKDYEDLEKKETYKIILTIISEFKDYLNKLFKDNIIFDENEPPKRDYKEKIYEILKYKKPNELIDNIIEIIYNYATMKRIIIFMKKLYEELKGKELKVDVSKFFIFKDKNSIQKILSLNEYMENKELIIDFFIFQTRRENWIEKIKILNNIALEVKEQNEIKSKKIPNYIWDCKLNILKKIIKKTNNNYNILLSLPLEIFCCKTEEEVENKYKIFEATEAAINLNIYNKKILSLYLLAEDIFTKFDEELFLFDEDNIFLDISVFKIEKCTHELFVKAILERNFKDVEKLNETNISDFNRQCNKISLAIFHCVRNCLAHSNGFKENPENPEEIILENIYIGRTEFKATISIDDMYKLLGQILEIVKNPTHRDETILNTNQFKIDTKDLDIKTFKSNERVKSTLAIINNIPDFEIERKLCDELNYTYELTYIGEDYNFEENNSNGIIYKNRFDSNILYIVHYIKESNLIVKTIFDKTKDNQQQINTIIEIKALIEEQKENLKIIKEKINNIIPIKKEFIIDESKFEKEKVQFRFIDPTTDFLITSIDLNTENISNNSFKIKITSKNSRHYIITTYQDYLDKIKKQKEDIKSNTEYYYTINEKREIIKIFIDLPSKEETIIIDPTFIIESKLNNTANKNM